MNETNPEKLSAVVHKLIAERAYELWENQGRPYGCDMIHWREAEREIVDCLEPNKMDSPTEHHWGGFYTKPEENPTLNVTVRAHSSR
jgi:hypothetical protein